MEDKKLPTPGEVVPAEDDVLVTVAGPGGLASPMRTSKKSIKRVVLILSMRSKWFAEETEGGET